jgi:hypothetical protein
VSKRKENMKRQKKKNKGRRRRGSALKRKNVSV